MVVSAEGEITRKARRQEERGGEEVAVCLSRTH